MLPQRPSPPQQGTGPWIHLQHADDAETASQTELYPNFVSAMSTGRLESSLHVQERYRNQHQPFPHQAFLSYHGAVDPVVAHQYVSTSVTAYPPLPPGHLQPPVAPLFALPPSSPTISIPTPHDATTESPPFSSLNPAGPDVCNRSQPRFNEQTQQWSCGGCNHGFSNKSGAQRHIATVGVKVACRYCGSQVSTLKSSRLRHLRRESCKSAASKRGITVPNEEDAFVEND
ncbi:hypothetical protein BJ322DRAFT_1049197 [Thelephora terrestris]|uniref:C2H2-type domain-containing protein n=1 Tax=Thelephora terrestris TaxID=56493 RepID=A0A9P6L8Z5_9AGAM|nr:hypothetical protein BJ322DRAFT_1049197 [Thelephora terrestris]